MSFDLYTCEAIALGNKTFLCPVVTLVPQPPATTVCFVTTGHSALSRIVCNWSHNSAYTFFSGFWVHPCRCTHHGSFLCYIILCAVGMI